MSPNFGECEFFFLSMRGSAQIFFPYRPFYLDVVARAPIAVQLYITNLNNGTKYTIYTFSAFPVFFKSYFPASKHRDIVALLQFISIG